jgi:beta-glucosidase
MSESELRDAKSATLKELPQGVIWGVSTSSYQIEGASDVDGRCPNVWDSYSRVPGDIANGDTGDVACDHYHRYREDIEIMRKMGVKAYRFSLAWPRVIPLGSGAANEAGLAFYDRLIDGLLAASIEPWPWLCLYHWDLPQALQNRGGWPNRDIAGWYADYAALVTQRYGDRVKHFATFNEPSVFTLFSYGFAWHPPGMTDPAALRTAIHCVSLAHGAGVDVLRAHVPHAAIGCVHNVQPSHPADDTTADADAAELLGAYWNRAFPDPQVLGHYPPALAKLMGPIIKPGDLERIRRPVDWFGVNHYSPIYANADTKAPLGFAWADTPAGVQRPPIGWQIDLAAFRDTLLDVHRRYQVPIYVTENGAGADEAPDAAGKVLDSERIAYLKTYTSALREAVASGADVRGYFVWSLLDNFELGAGYSNRFGMVYVDYPTQRRIPKESARWYAQMIRAKVSRAAGPATHASPSAPAPVRALVRPAIP